MARTKNGILAKAAARKAAAKAKYAAKKLAASQAKGQGASNQAPASAPVKKGPGRPKGSKNKVKAFVQNVVAVVKKRAGRPKKAEVTEPAVGVQTRAQKRKLVNVDDNDNQQAEPPKKTRGRPPSFRKKPKQDQPGFVPKKVGPAKKKKSNIGDDVMYINPFADIPALAQGQAQPQAGPQLQTQIKGAGSKRARVDAEDDSPNVERPAKRRGRPPGSKNKKTVRREDIRSTFEKAKNAARRARGIYVVDEDENQPEAIAAGNGGGHIQEVWQEPEAFADANGAGQVGDVEQDPEFIGPYSNFVGQPQQQENFRVQTSENRVNNQFPGGLPNPAALPAQVEVHTPQNQANNQFPDGLPGPVAVPAEVDDEPLLAPTPRPRYHARFWVDDIENSSDLGGGATDYQGGDEDEVVPQSNDRYAVYWGTRNGMPVDQEPFFDGQERLAAQLYSLTDRNDGLMPIQQQTQLQDQAEETPWAANFDYNTYYGHNGNAQQGSQIDDDDDNFPNPYHRYNSMMPIDQGPQMEDDVFTPQASIPFLGYNDSAQQGEQIEADEDITPQQSTPYYTYHGIIGQQPCFQDEDDETPRAANPYYGYDGTPIRQELAFENEDDETPHTAYLARGYNLIPSHESKYES